MDTEQALYWRGCAHSAIERRGHLTQALAMIGLSGDKAARPIVEQALYAAPPQRDGMDWDAYAEAVEEHCALLDAALVEITQKAGKASQHTARIAIAAHRHAGGAHWGEEAA